MKANTRIENLPTNQLIASLDLWSNIKEVEDLGYTVISPSKVADKTTKTKILKKILEIAQSKTGNKFNLSLNASSGSYKALPQTESQFVLYSLLFADNIFEKWLQNPVVVALSSYLLNDQAQLSSMSSFIKWKGRNYKDSMGLHADTQPSPNGLLPSQWVDACNSVYCLTDYTEDDGALAVVPESHKIARQPKHDDFNYQDIIPVEAEAGSLIFWHGNLWHGAYPKKTDGLRVNLTTFMTHRRIKTQENIKDRVTADMLKRNPSKQFARLVGLNDSNGFDENGPNMNGIINYGTEDQMQRFTFNIKDV